MPMGGLCGIVGGKRCGWRCQDRRDVWDGDEKGNVFSRSVAGATDFATEKWNHALSREGTNSA